MDSLSSQESSPEIPPTPHTLTEAHYHALHVESGIAPEVIRQRGYRSIVDPGELQELGFSKSQARHGTPGLLLPTWGVEGRRVSCQIRPDLPRITPAGKMARYQSPKGSRNYLDCHPSAQLFLGDPSVPLWVTEGAKKADSLLSHGAQCVLALSGVWNFVGQNEHGGKVVLPDWQHVALNDRRVFVAFDSDLATKKGVQQALKALYQFLRSKGAIPTLLQWTPEFQTKKWGVDDFFVAGHTFADLQAMVPTPGPLPPRHLVRETEPWRAQLSQTKSGDVKETFANLVLGLQHLSPWNTDCWYDVVREVPMCGIEPLSDDMIGKAALALEQQVHVSIRALKLVQAALVHHCRATPRDELQEWLTSLKPWDDIERLDTWFSDHAGAPKTAYGIDVSRLLIVSMVARALNPGCQYRYVAVLMGNENIGKSKLVKALASPAWYREVSHSLEGKEAHMILQGAWVAELAELASMGKTAEARLKSFITMESDDYIPKFSNLAVSRKRRTIFIATVNPEGDGTLFRGQTGNTRYLPIPVTDINVADVLTNRDQLFAEALVYYGKHPRDWWQLSSDGQTEAVVEREKRRQESVYEVSLAAWLEGKTQTTWEDIAQHYLLLEAKEKWKDKGLQMEVATALRALRWTKEQRWNPTHKKSEKAWFPPK